MQSEIITVRVTPEEKLTVIRRAQQLDRSPSYVVRMAIRELVKGVQEPSQNKQPAQQEQPAAVA